MKLLFLLAVAALLDLAHPRRVLESANERILILLLHEVCDATRSPVLFDRQRHDR